MLFINKTEYSDNFLNPIRLIAENIASDLNITTSDIIIHFDNDVEFGTCGSCKQSINKKTYMVIINPDSAIYGDELNYWFNIEEITKTIKHELRHVWQFVTGIIKNTEYGLVWKGELIKENTLYNILFSDVDFEEYENYPWEIDAREYAGE